MIAIKITPAVFEYDVQSLVQAFYPGQDFQVNKEDASASKTIQVFFRDNEITAEISAKGLEFLKAQKKISVDCQDEAQRRIVKNELKKVLYELFVKDTGKELPWGNLTGIRPAKIPALMMEEGKTEEEIRLFMKEEYLISEEKLNLAMQVANKERQLLQNMDYKNGYSLYVGIPFCPTTCLYCSFTSFPVQRYREKIDDYVSAVIKEMEFLGEQLKGRELNTVYIGGGTPTTLEPEHLKRLIEALKSNFDFTTVREFTVEAGRPDSITEEKLMVLKECGVDRISINPQTMNEETLKIIGRKHTVEQVKDAFKMARKAGFDNVNMDFILGLPEETEEMIRYSFEEAAKLQPESLTVHSLALKRASRMSMNYGKYQDLKMENDSDLMKIAASYAEGLQMEPYYLYRQKNMAGNQENIGYAIPGKECLYNILMMGDYQDVWAVGAGAVTKLLSENRLEGKRIDTLKNVDLYIERIDEMIERKAEFFRGL
ncbi:MAG: coproporphyrinogen dehydrogenase HemZ [Eubacterium sp.]|nr:coproporphyrinogen dehydrogenase HemZ [Eubacterium sp.]